MDAVVFGDTNLELPSVHSNRSLVEVHTRMSISTLFQDTMMVWKSTYAIFYFILFYFMQSYHLITEL